jgi:predicted aspartyl protease
VMFPFNPKRGLIRVQVDLSGPAGQTVVYLALDTGATSTLIGLGALQLAGYDPTVVGQKMQIITGSGTVQAYRLPVASLAALGQTRTGFPVIAHTLPPGASVDGVLGLDFLRGNVLTIDFIQGEINLDPGAPAGPGVTP